MPSVVQRVSQDTVIRSGEAHLEEHTQGAGLSPLVPTQTWECVPQHCVEWVCSLGEGLMESHVCTYVRI